jgi:hypothetical protein
MVSPIVSMPSMGTNVLERERGSLKNHDADDVIVVPGTHNRSARGAMTGMVLGASLWGAILVLVGVIKL